MKMDKENTQWIIHPLHTKLLNDNGIFFEWSNDGLFFLLSCFFVSSLPHLINLSNSHFLEPSSLIISILQPGELYYSKYICVPCTFGDNYIMSYSALFYCVFEEINEVLEN